MPHLFAVVENLFHNNHVAEILLIKQHWSDLLKSSLSENVIEYCSPIRFIDNGKVLLVVCHPSFTLSFPVVDIEKKIFTLLNRKIRLRLARS